MSRHVVKLPDLGEGTVSSEIVAWHVKVGDRVSEDQPMVEMSTDKAVVEMPAPVSGRVVSLGGEPGDHIAVGAELIVLETSDAAAAEPEKPASAPAPAERQPERQESNIRVHPTAERAKTAPAEKARTGRVLASPATRMRAREAGIDLTTVVGTGRDGRIQRQDLESAISGHAQPGTSSPARVEVPRHARTETEEIRILGVRRVSAQRVADSKRNIPHFAYVEEVDVTELERLRRHLNAKLPQGTPGYTYLPFLALALVRVIERLPKCNSLYDAERNVLVRHRGVHVGVATQTSDGLKVPVVRHVEALSLHQVAAEIRRVTEAARKGTATRNELRGSTITITSLGKLGGIVSTPIINAPEVAIIGVNKAVERPVVQNGQIAVRLMMNLSSSFDHRFIDGYDAAETIQALKELLEQPATIFIEAVSG
jgi:2-oxoisovalerate dehydrogenase E2 component (dihydrolipoyl transacylase)